MSKNKLLENTWIKGEFSSDFSTEIIQEIDNPSMVIRELILEGRKFVHNCTFENQDFVPEHKSLSLKNRFVSSAELFPVKEQDFPLDTPRKFNLNNTHIYNVSISNEQNISGVIHGQITGDIFGQIQKIEKIEKTQFSKTTENELVTKIEDEVSAHSAIKEELITEDNDIYHERSIDTKMATPIGQGIQRGSGCLPTSRRGCGGLISLLILFGLLFLLFRNCSSSGEEQNNQEDNLVDQENYEEDNDYEYIEENSDGDSFEEETEGDFIEGDVDSSIVIDDNTIQEYRTVSLPQVQFFTNSDSLLISSEKELDKLAVYLLENQQLKARIIGHTDDKGDDDKNMELSTERAKSVKVYLENQGVQKNRIEAIGKGETEPKASNDTEEGRLMNRRVEVEVIEKINKETNN